jgi:hypothetical protein
VEDERGGGGAVARERTRRCMRSGGEKHTGGLLETLPPLISSKPGLLETLPPLVSSKPGQDPLFGLLEPGYGFLQATKQA